MRNAQLTMNKEDNIGRLVQAVCKPEVPQPEFKEGLLKRLQTEVSTSNRDEVVKLRETGLSQAEIGRRLDITREREYIMVDNSEECYIFWVQLLIFYQLTGLNTYGAEISKKKWLNNFT